MPVNLFPIIESQVSLQDDAPEYIQSVPSNAAKGSIHFHPRYERFLKRIDLATAEKILNHPGEIVCGHPDRHVCRVELMAANAGRVLYVKREHQIGWRVRFRNWRDGFGAISRCEREAQTLQALEQAGMPGPQWLAYGTDGQGRAFLIVDEVPDAADLLTFCRISPLLPTDRRVLIERLGRTFAELHEAGFSTPEMSAKHILIQKRSLDVTLIDWQSAPRVSSVQIEDRLRQFATLYATTRELHFGFRDQLRLLWAYRRVLRRMHAKRSLPRISSWVSTILSHSERIQDRSHVRDQRNLATNQRLIWLAGEQVCVVPEIEPYWPEPADGEPFYSKTDDPLPMRSGLEWITFSHGLRAVLVRQSSQDPWGRCMSWLREKPWRSAGATAGRILFHLARHGVPGPKLLGFGQRLTSRISADSFIVYRPTATTAIAIAMIESIRKPELRNQFLSECGYTIRALHDSGGRFRFEPDTEFRLVASSSPMPNVAIGSPFAVRLCRRVGMKDRVSDLRGIFRLDLPGLSKWDCYRVIKAYTFDWPRSERRRYLRAIL